MRRVWREGAGDKKTGLWLEADERRMVPLSSLSRPSHLQSLCADTGSASLEKPSGVQERPEITWIWLKPGVILTILCAATEKPVELEPVWLCASDGSQMGACKALGKWQKPKFFFLNSQLVPSSMSSWKQPTASLQTATPLAQPHVRDPRPFRVSGMYSMEVVSTDGLYGEAEPPWGNWYTTNILTFYCKSWMIFKHV